MVKLYIKNSKNPWKYEALAAEIKKIIKEDECNDTYGYVRMYEALKLKKSRNPEDFPKVPCERTIYHIMKKLNLVHKSKRKPNGLTKVDKEAIKSDDKIKRNFK